MNNLRRFVLVPIEIAVPTWNRVLLFLVKACRFGAGFLLQANAAAQRNSLGHRLALRKPMSSCKEELLVQELQELRNLESQLQMKWRRLKRAGKGVRASFVSSLSELQARTQQLERLLDSYEQRAA